MIRDYKIGLSESLDFKVTGAGAGIIPVRADSVYANAFSELTLYSDSARLIPLSSGAYEKSTIDTILTANEALTGGTGDTVYSDYEILDPTYQTGTIYGTITNFGTYTNGVSVGQDYIVLSDADYAFTIEPTIYETILDCSNFTADRTITFTQGEGANIRNKVTIINPSDYLAILTNSIDTFWGESNDMFQVYFNQDTFTRSKGWGLIYVDATLSSPYINNSALLESFSKDNRYNGSCSSATESFSMNFGVYETSTVNYKSPDIAGGDVPRYDVSNTRFYSGNTNFDWYKMYKWYTGF